LYIIIIFLFYLLLIYGGEQGEHPGSHSNPIYSEHPLPQSHHILPASVVVVVGAAVVVVVGAQEPIINKLPGSFVCYCI
jgi:hypothetical protein